MAAPGGRAGGGGRLPAGAGAALLAPLMWCEACGSQRAAPRPQAASPGVGQISLPPGLLALPLSQRFPFAWQSPRPRLAFGQLIPGARGQCVLRVRDPWQRLPHMPRRSAWPWPGLCSEPTSGSCRPGEGSGVDAWGVGGHVDASLRVARRQAVLRQWPGLRPLQSTVKIAHENGVSGHPRRSPRCSSAGGNALGKAATRAPGPGSHLEVPPQNLLPGRVGQPLPPQPSPEHPPPAFPECTWAVGTPRGGCANAALCPPPAPEMPAPPQGPWAPTSPPMRQSMSSRGWKGEVTGDTPSTSLGPHPSREPPDPLSPVQHSGAGFAAGDTVPA